MEDREGEQSLLKTVEKAGSDARVLAMLDGEEMLGWAAVEAREGTLWILKLAAGAYDFSYKPGMEEIFVLDALMRAAASYGENHGAQKIETAFPDFFDFFKLRKFSIDDTHAFTDMSTIIHYG